MGPVSSFGSGSSSGSPFLKTEATPHWRKAGKVAMAVVVEQINSRGTQAGIIVVKTAAEVEAAAANPRADAGPLAAHNVC